MVNSAQESTEYKPTPKEKLLIKVLINPINRTKNITEICELVPCDRHVYYDAFKKPGFVAIVEEEARNIVKQAVLPVIHSFTKEASRGSVQHGKILLEMAGLYTEKAKQEVTIEDKTDVKERLIYRINEVVTRKGKTEITNKPD